MHNNAIHVVVFFSAFVTIVGKWIAKNIVQDKDAEKYVLIYPGVDLYLHTCDLIQTIVFGHNRCLNNPCRHFHGQTVADFHSQLFQLRRFGGTPSHSF